MKTKFRAARIRVKMEVLVPIRPISALTLVPAVRISSEQTVKTKFHAARIRAKMEDRVPIRPISAPIHVLVLQVSLELTAINSHSHSQRVGE